VCIHCIYKQTLGSIERRFDIKKSAVMVAEVSIVALAALTYGDMGSHGMGSGMTCGCGADGQRMEAEHHML
jgi:hypothetical protein